MFFIMLIVDYYFNTFIDTRIEGWGIFAFLAKYLSFTCTIYEPNTFFWILEAKLVISNKPIKMGKRDHLFWIKQNWSQFGSNKSLILFENILNFF